MKKLVLLVGIISLTIIGCNNEAKKSDVEKKISENDRIFETLHSIGKMNADSLFKSTTVLTDSLLLERKLIQATLTESEFNKLAKSLDNKLLDIGFAKKILPGFDSVLIDIIFESEDGLLPTERIKFDKKGDYWALIPGMDDGPLSPSSTVYFFHKNQIIGAHSIYHKYGLKIDHFLNPNGNPVIYYNDYLMTGSGVWWYQSFFFTLTPKEIIPSHSIPQALNCQYPWQDLSFYITTNVITTNPLTYGCGLSSDLNSRTSAGVPIQEDSLLLSFEFDEKNNKYVFDPGKSTVSPFLLSSFFFTAPKELWVNAYYPLLNKILIDKKDPRQKSVRRYLRDFYLEESIDETN